MIDKTVRRICYVIIILGFVYMGIHLYLYHQKHNHPVFKELRKELRNPTPKAVYMERYREFLTRQERSGSAGNHTFSLSFFKTALPFYAKQEKTKSDVN